MKTQTLTTFTSGRHSPSQNSLKRQYMDSNSAAMALLHFAQGLQRTSPVQCVCGCHFKKESVLYLPHQSPSENQNPQIKFIKDVLHDRVKNESVSIPGATSSMNIMELTNVKIKKEKLSCPSAGGDHRKYPLRERIPYRRVCLGGKVINEIVEAARKVKSEASSSRLRCQFCEKSFIQEMDFRFHIAGAHC